MDVKHELPQSGYLELAGFIFAPNRTAAFITLLTKVCCLLVWWLYILQFGNFHLKSLFLLDPGHQQFVKNDDIN